MGDNRFTVVFEGIGFEERSAERPPFCGEEDLSAPGLATPLTGLPDRGVAGDAFVLGVPDNADLYTGRKTFNLRPHFFLIIGGIERSTYTSIPKDIKQEMQSTNIVSKPKTEYFPGISPVQHYPTRSY